MVSSLWICRSDTADLNQVNATMSSLFMIFKAQTEQNDIPENGKGKLMTNWKISIAINEKINYQYQWPFSLAMLVITRGYIRNL